MFHFIERMKCIKYLCTYKDPNCRVLYQCWYLQNLDIFHQQEMALDCCILDILFCFHLHMVHCSHQTQSILPNFHSLDLKY